MDPRLLGFVLALGFSATAPTARWVYELVALNSQPNARTMKILFPYFTGVQALSRCLQKVKYSWRQHVYR